MANRKSGSTAALLQKANSQLKGEKIKRPEDELNAYISSLTQKTSQQKKSVNFEDLGDSISISSELEEVPYKARPDSAISAGASKFLKKKTPTAEQDGTPAPVASKFLKKPQGATASPSPAPSAQNRYGPQSGQGVGQRPSSQTSMGRPGSSALDKASALTGKIQQRVAARRTFTLESDSDESFSALKMARTSVEQPSESLTTESVKIGRDGGKFLKKATPTAAPVQSFEPPLTSVTQVSRVSAADKQKKQDTQQKKASPYTLKSSLKYSTDVVLTSEEESLAEFVGGLPSSSGDSFEKPRKKARRPSPPPSKQRSGHRSPSPPPPARSGRQTPRGHSRSVSPQNKPPVIRRTPSPSPRTNGQSPSPVLRRRSPSPKLARSYSDDSNVAESIKSEIAEDFDIGLNIIMDLDDLGLAEEADLSSPPSSFRATARKSEKETKKSHKTTLKSTSDKSLKDKNRQSSPFKATKEKEASPFKSSSNREKSPFKANAETTESSFKSSGSKDKSPFKTQESSSPFKAGNKENQSTFKAASKKSDSPFSAKTGNSLFKASAGGSVFKSSDKDRSPFKAGGSSKTKDDRSSSPFKANDRSSPTKKSKNKRDKKTSKSKPKSKKNETSDLFSSFGLQTVEDLFGGTSIKESEYESLLSEVDEVKSEITEDIKTEKPGMYSYSQRFEDSETEIVSEYEGTKQSGPSYTEDFDSISEKIGASSDRGQSSASEVKTRYSREDSVPEYTEFSESDTESTVTHSRSTEDDSDRTYSDTYTTYTEEYTKSVVRTSRSDITPRVPPGMTSAEVQTMEDGLYYSWNPMGSGMAYPGVQYGLGFVDPTPIATQVVSADALEAMTAYSPAMLALHDMLKSQLELTREFLDSQKRLYEDFSRNIQCTYHYTTLEDTKQYIKKHKKKKLTFKEALKLVDQESGR